ncbi:MAG: hypothetical protein ABJA10_10840 [Aestuariivirga sp.]
MAAPVRQGAIKAGAAAAAGLLLLAAVGCVTAAIWIFAAPYLGAAGAALIVAAYLLLAGLGVIGIAAWNLRTVVGRTAATPASPAPLILNQLFVEQKGTLLMAALVAGMMAAESQHKRR